MVMVKTTFEERWPLAFERILSKITVDAASGCWIYNTNRAGNGYSQIVVARRVHAVHRIAARGFEVQGWKYLDTSKLSVVHHECRQRMCVNPDHLIVFVGPREHEAHHRAQAASRGEKRAGAPGAGNYMFGRRKDGTPAKAK